MKYQAVLFDMDGTVLDTLDDLTDAVNACFRHFGLPAVERGLPALEHGAQNPVLQAAAAQALGVVPGHIPALVASVEHCRRGCEGDWCQRAAGACRRSLPRCR